jgi:hypothetical protein
MTSSLHAEIPRIIEENPVFTEAAGFAKAAVFYPCSLSPCQMAGENRFSVEQAVRSNHFAENT